MSLCQQGNRAQCLVRHEYLSLFISLSTCLSLTSSVSSQSKMPQQGSFSTRDVVTTPSTRPSAPRAGENYIKGGGADVSCSAMAAHHLTWRRHSHVSPTCRTDAGSGPPPLNSLTFRPVVGQLSEVVPFLLLERRCEMASSLSVFKNRLKTYTCSTAATKLLDFNDISFS